MIQSLLLAWDLNSKVDILKQRQNDLVQNVFPELKVKVIIVLVQDLEQNSKSLILDLLSFLHD